MYAQEVGVNSELMRIMKYCTIYLSRKCDFFVKNELVCCLRCQQFHEIRYVHCLKCIRFIRNYLISDCFQFGHYKNIQVTHSALSTMTCNLALQEVR